jgi:flavin reductase (DIM6/NTAB) family NADH-FMN oxidoreductase RutF
MDAQDKKIALRAITYGLYVLTARDGDRFAAAGINWVTQTSFDPPLIAVGVKTDNDSHALIEATGKFAINVLGDDQLDIAKAFFRSTKVEDGKLNGYTFEDGPETGSPLLVDLPYWWEATVTDTVKGGDHTVFVAEVVNAGVRNAEALPLNLRATGMNYGG